MDKTIKLLGLIVASVMIVSSCAIEKRVHQSGFHIVKKTTPKKTKKSDKEELTVVEYDLAIAEKTVQNEVEIKPNKSILQSNNNSKSISKKETKSVEKSTIGEVKQSKKSTPTSNSLFKQTENKVSYENHSVDSFSFYQTEKLEKKRNRLADTMTILILVLCFVLPPLAVWLMTEDATLTLISLLLSLLLWLPGIIFALFIFLKNN